MPSTRPRRIVRCALLALAVAVMLAGGIFGLLALRESPDLQRSRGIKLGMSRRQAEEVMGNPATVLSLEYSNGITVLYFGSPTDTADMLLDIRTKFAQWTNSTAPLRHEEWPIQVYLGKSGNVIRIIRGRDVEE